MINVYARYVDKINKSEYRYFLQSAASIDEAKDVCNKLNDFIVNNMERIKTSDKNEGYLHNPYDPTKLLLTKLHTYDLDYIFIEEDSKQELFGTKTINV